MSNDKEMADKDKVTHAQEVQKAEGNEENSEITKDSSSEALKRTKFQSFSYI